MAGDLSTVYRLATRVSRMSIVVASATVILFHIAGQELPISWQLAVALFGLAIGIPHGAIDHLISIPSHPRNRFFLYITSYVVIAVIAGLAIATWNLIAFEAVLIMSGLHFGFGDASFINESRTAQGDKSEPLLIEIFYAIPAGFLPVILPLTDSRATSALERIRHSLVSWSGTHSHLLRTIVFASAATSILIFLATRRLSLALDLALLLGLSTYAPPLIAFAMYFGFWHAQRHTARLVPRLPKALALAHSGEAGKAIIAAITPGLYAVLGSLALASVLMVLSRKAFSSSLLWSVLVIIWALTVPHMISTAKLDNASLRGKFFAS